MICPNCGLQLPDDSEFCQYCGSKISVPAEQVTPVVEIDTPEQNTIPKSLPIVTVSESPNVHENGNNEPLNATSSEKKAPKKWIVSVICLSVLLLALAGLNVYQYLSAQRNEAKAAELSAAISELDSKIKRLNSTISEKDIQIKNKNSDITTLNKKVSSLTDDADKYEAIVDAVKYGNLGYAASNFQSSECVIVVGQNEKNRKFTLTANWSNGGTVSVDYDTYSPAAYVNFDQDSWTTSTKITIQPKHSGVTVVTFSNNVNRQTFDVIIIVE